ncbi:MAG: PTS sugar transporter subunit IIA [Planctomycetota bacterium]
MFSQSNPLFILSLVLVAGVAAGSVCKRLHIPSVTGQLLIGILLGESVLGLFDHATIERLSPVMHFALGLMAVAVGSHLSLKKLRNAKKRLSLLVGMELTFTPLLVGTAVLALSDAPWQMALLLGTLAVSTAPATILALVKETRSKGVFVKTLVAATALNNLGCICLFELAHAAARVSFDSSLSTADLVLAPLKEVCLSGFLGGGVGIVLVILTRRVVSSDRLTAISMVAILLTAGLAEQIGASTLLAGLVLGVVLANLTPDKEEIGHEALANLEYAIFAVFFTLAGMELQLQYVWAGGLVAVLVLAARFFGKVGAAGISMRWAGATKGLRRYLGIALVPQAGLAVGLLLAATEDPHLAPMRDQLLAIGLTVVLGNELLGPVLTRAALRRSGDAGKDRARLIDFLHEENIVTDLEAETKEEAIRRITDVLVQSNHLAIDPEVLLQSILDRERAGSTCIGGGLSIPHARLEEGDAIIGAMGISQKGLGFDAPDGKPVHCVVLLATPPAEANRHLQVLATLAREIGNNPRLQSELYHAKSPAHAYDLLHAEEYEDWNYFLED